MHHRVAMGDINIQLVERVAAKPLEILLNLHRYIVPCQIMAQLVAVAAKFVGNR